MVVSLIKNLSDFYSCIGRKGAVSKGRYTVPDQPNEMYEMYELSGWSLL